jgi:hypothetical protein
MKAKDFIEWLRNETKNTAQPEVTIYYHLFSAMERDRLEVVLEGVFSRIKKERNDVLFQEWFYDFHKSIRQTDFFGDTFVYWEENMLDEEGEDELSILLGVLPTHGGKGTIWEGVVDTKEAVKMGLDAELARYRHLRSMQKKQNRRNVSAHLDMTLWNVIHMDNNNVLQNLFEKFLKFQPEIA